MKALKSPLASKLLADPKARDELRRFLTTERSGFQAKNAHVADEARIRSTQGQAVRATIVPKAKAA